MQKRIRKIFMLSVVVILMTMCFAFGASAEDRSIVETGSCGANGDNVTYVLYDDGELVISGEGEMKNDNSNTLLFSLFQSNDSIIKVTIKGEITNIGNYAFYNCRNLIEIKLPTSVLSIGDGAFSNCTSLKTFSIPDSITYIGEDAFSGCSSITKVKLPTQIQTIFSGTFSDCISMSIIEFPDNLTRIESNAFSNCSSIVDIDLPDKLNTIGGWAFSGCDSIKNLKIHAQIKYVGAEAFDCIIENLYIESLESWLNLESDFISFNNLYVNKKLTTEIAIPNSVKEIRPYSFYNCKSITSIIIPNEVSLINSYAFFGCKNLKNITIGNGIKIISKEAFNNCTSLETIKLGSGVSTIESYAFDNSPNLKDVYYNGTEKSWNEILIYDENDSLINATIHCICEHNYPDEWSVLIPATCTERGVSVKVCSQCFKVDSKVIPAGHIDDNEDGICDKCGFNGETKPEEPSKPDTPSEPSTDPTPETPQEPTEECDCDCHRNGFMSFIYNILNFFRTLFGVESCCDC